MTARTSPRAVKAVAELRAAIDALKSSQEPNATNVAIVELLEATAAYWLAWLPAEPTRLDRAALGLARAITRPPDAAAGSLPQTSTAPSKGKATS
jgi:hypothetical protein